MMTNENEQRRTRKRALLLGNAGRMATAVAIFGLSATGIAVLLTGAVLTDSETVTPNVFTVKGIDLTVSNNVSLPYNVPGMVPGQKVFASLDVANAGANNVNFNYKMDSLASNVDGKGLRSQLELTVKLIADGATCNQTTFTASATTLSSTAAMDLGNAPTALAIIPNRALANGDADTLCFLAELPAATDETYAGATTSATFTFSAEQV